MKSFREYLNESEETFDRPIVGDNFAINIREETLLETYIVDEIEDGIVLHADEKTMNFLESYGYLGEALSESQDFEIDSDEDSNDIEVTDQGEYDQEGDMAKDDLATIVRAARRLTGMLDDNENMPEWVQSKINKAADYVDTAADYIESNKDQDLAEGAKSHSELARLAHEAYIAAVRQGNAQMANHYKQAYEKHKRLAASERKSVAKGMAEGEMDEAKYQGREVPLGKPMAGDVAKSKVYVRDPKTGNVKKVNFGDPNMRIKKSDPDRRRSFRARHNCDNPGPRTKARYWSCRAW